ncbi:efflux transporter outer membrane subunit [Terriglobus aquaticus]|uniref:Efflux transporter outer membrane subunit n=1 Tax=Terriglobus aquaticus TaxID=940139 RepID=A0ABW9KLK3_9BACT|nr:efflux transporter outer membrane subunit [Terriglobus aquaticus]
MNRSLLQLATAVASISLVLVGGCRVGPNYTAPPPTATAPAFKEAPPQSFEGWKAGTPSAAQLKGDWWTMFGDPQLNALEPQVDTANQTLVAAEANFRAARTQIGFARSQSGPQIAISPSLQGVRDSVYQPYFNQANANSGVSVFSLPVDLNYEVDLWGRIRRGVTQAREEAQAAAGDLENARLSLHAELAMDYFGLRSADAQETLLDSTIQVYQQAVQLTQDRYQGGVSPYSDLTQAQTQLQQARVQRTDLEQQRAQYEHAIAVLIGKAPAELTIPPTSPTLKAPDLPNIPGALPSELLERRPDISADERRVAAANEQIGIAEAAYYPTLTISGSGGFIGNSLLNWFSFPARYFAVGPQLSQVLYDRGRRRSLKELSQAQYDQTVAEYRQTTLSAFQQVEDNLAALRVLQTEAEQQRAATTAAKESQNLFEIRYQGGVDTFLQVVTYQTAALNNQRNEIVIMQRRLDASVLLIKALGGGWNTTQLPKV